ncbi:ThiF family adenylyltransferase [Catenulispora subtropica]|uniref:THIF-type NAD/FAD binding fold domain-containing protein n=1 Tax=Catenulispora subtropica TaxID=450798 RepID=A0ABN2S5D5_9ACTN
MLRPRLKPGHRPQIHADGKVWFGPWVHGLATEIEDEDGVLRALISRMDGSLTRGELVLQATAALPPGVAGPEDVGEVLDFLIQSGWVHDAAAVLPPQLGYRDLARHKRTLEYFDTVNLDPATNAYEMLATLKAARVAVLGVGGVGSAVAAGLVASGVGGVHCVDHDRVELSNLSRQLLFTEADVGRRKVGAAVRRLTELNSDAEVTAEEVLLDGADAVARVVIGHDAFVLCADRPRGLIRRWANEAAYRLGIPFLNAAYIGPEMSLSTFIPGRTVCMDCLNAGFAERSEEMGLLRHVPDETDDHHPVIAASAAIAGHYVALETIHLLLGMRVQTAGRSLQRYLIDYDQQHYIEGAPRPDCAVGCGKRMGAP